MRKRVTISEGRGAWLTTTTGQGREGSRQGIEEYLEVEYISMPIRR